MKTFYLTTLLLSLGIATNAQTEKGTMNINGKFGSNSGGQYYIESNGLIKSLSIDINPNIGYFVKNNWEIGAGVSLSMTRSRYTNVIQGNMDKQSANGIGLQAYSKYYFGSGLVKPYVTIGGGHKWVSNKSKYVGGSTQSYNYNDWSAEGGAGVVWFVSPKVGLFSQLTYTRRWQEIRYSSGAVNLNFGIQVNLGNKK